MTSPSDATTSPTSVMHTGCPSAQGGTTSTSRVYGHVSSHGTSSASSSVGSADHTERDTTPTTTPSRSVLRHRRQQSIALYGSEAMRAYSDDGYGSGGSASLSSSSPEIEDSPCELEGSDSVFQDSLASHRSRTHSDGRRIPLSERVATPGARRQAQRTPIFSYAQPSVRVGKRKASRRTSLITFDNVVRVYNIPVEDEGHRPPVEANAVPAAEFEERARLRQENTVEARLVRARYREQQLYKRTLATIGMFVFAGLFMLYQAAKLGNY